MRTAAAAGARGSPSAAAYPPAMPTTDQLRQIASQVGVSLSTVYRVLNGDIKGKRADNAARAEEIRRIAASLGYRPNSAAKAMSSGRFNCAAIVVPTVKERGFIHQGTFRGIQEELERASMHLAVARLDDAQLGEPDGGPRFLREWMCDGLMISYGDDVPPQLQQLVRRQRLPAVWINVQLDWDAVNLDDAQGAYLATDHLVKLGHTRIAYVDYHRSGHYSVLARRMGYLKAMQNAGCPPMIVHHDGPVPLAERFAFTKSWLSRPDRPTATVGYGPEDALNVSTGALALGLRIPEDLSIVAIHEEPLTTNGIVFTTAWVPTEQVGHAAVRMLVQKIDNPRLSLPLQSIPYQVTPGQSTARV